MPASNEQNEGPELRRETGTQQTAVRVRLPRITRPADHPLMTVREAAERLGCSEMTIRRRIAARQFPAVKTGRKSMIPRSFVDRLLAQAEAGHTVVVDEAAAEWKAEGVDRRT